MNKADITKFININLLRIFRAYNTWPEDLIDDETEAPLDYESLIEKATEHLAQHKFLAIFFQQYVPTIFLKNSNPTKNIYENDENKEEYFIDRNQLLTPEGDYQLIIIIDP